MIQLPRTDISAIKLVSRLTPTGKTCDCLVQIHSGVLRDFLPSMAVEYGKERRISVTVHCQKLRMYIFHGYTTKSWKFIKTCKHHWTLKMNVLIRHPCIHDEPTLTKLFAQLLVSFDVTGSESV